MSPSRSSHSPEPELSQHLLALIPQRNRASLRDSVLPKLLTSISAIGKGLRACSDVAIVGNSNAFGDEQLNVDLLAEDILRKAIDKCPVIRTASSEEDPIERPTSNQQVQASDSNYESYTVAFDPLDGSSIIGPNWSVGTIIGIWDGVTSLNQPSEKQVAAILGVYGPRTLAIVALRVPETAPICFEVSLEDSQEIRVVRSGIRFAKPPFKARYFAPANLRAAAESEKYLELVTRFVREKYTLRYSGGLIPDLFHALVKGHGIYISPVTATSKAKLRKLYELYPVALVIECAGGLAIDPENGSRILDYNVKGCDDRGGLVCGTASEVETVKQVLLE
ncbi:Fc.00g072780.m01.CDS01 [Cosmosporella sp. VM-42]